MRQPKCIRKSHHFLIPVGPFMDQWGEDIGKSELLSIEEKAEIVCALYDGFKRQDQAFGYCRAFGALIAKLPGGMSQLEEYIPFDVMAEMKVSKFREIASESKENFEGRY